MSRLIALDVGEVRVGVAISDAERILASPYTTFHVTRDYAQLWASIQRAIEETGATALVVGLPVSLDGQIHAQGERILAFVEQLKQQVSISITLWDERFSTVEARRLLSEREQDSYVDERGKRRRQGRAVQSRSRRRKGQEIDALAAAVILQDYLDHLRRSSSSKD
jgi:putative holliday junction resolvase